MTTPPTLAALDAAFFAALAATQHDASAGGPYTDAAPFACVDRFVGELAPDSIHEACAAFPAALLRFDGGTAKRTVDAVEGVDDTGAEAWTVLVAVEDPRSITDAATGATPVAGYLVCIERVLEVCNGLVVEGLWRDRRVRVTSYGKPLLVKRGELYVFGVSFVALRELPQAPLTIEQRGGDQALTQIAGDVNLEDTADAAPNPIESFLAF